MKNQICFSLKIRSGARTPLYISCDPLCVNDNEISIGCKKVSASTISKVVISSIIRYFNTSANTASSSASQIASKLMSSSRDDGHGEVIINSGEFYEAVKQLRASA